jgi:hypothetical protein
MKEVFLSMIKNTLSIVLHEPIGVVGEIIPGTSHVNASLENARL